MQASSHPNCVDNLLEIERVPLLEYVVQWYSIGLEIDLKLVLRLESQ